MFPPPPFSFASNDYLSPFRNGNEITLHLQLFTRLNIHPPEIALILIALAQSLLWISFQGPLAGGPLRGKVIRDGPFPPVAG
jgi:hypothetical protein